MHEHYTFWCARCAKNTAHVMNKGRFWDWICIFCGKREIIGT